MTRLNLSCKKPLTQSLESVTHLTIRQSNLTRLTVVPQCLISLDLTNNKLETLDSIANVLQLKSLKSLSLGHNFISSLISAKITAPLIFIDLHGNQLRSLIGSEKLMNIQTLTGLNLKENMIESLGTTVCNSLTYLNVSRNPIKAIEVIQAVQKIPLQRLYFTGTNSKSRQAQLTPEQINFDLSFTGITQMSQISWLNTRQVTIIDLSNNDFSNGILIDQLLQIKTIQSIKLSSCKISNFDIKMVSGSLQELDVSDNVLDTIDNDVLSIFPEFRSLDAHNNFITSFIYYQGGFSNLANLNLQNNKIKQISNIAQIFEIKSLVNLNLRLNPFQQGSRLPRMVGSKLQSIDIAQTLIPQGETAIELFNNTKIMRIHIRTQQCLEQHIYLGGMRQLVLNSCGITNIHDIGFVFGIPNLERLSLSNNHIRTLKGIRGGRFLTELRLLQNEIQTVDDLSPIIQMPRLRILILNSLQKNVQPICCDDKINVVMEAYPQLISVQSWGYDDTGWSKTKVSAEREALNNLTQTKLMQLDLYNNRLSQQMYQTNMQIFQRVNKVNICQIELNLLRKNYMKKQYNIYMWWDDIRTQMDSGWIQ